MSKSKFSNRILSRLMNIDIEVRSKKWLEIKNIEKFIESQAKKLLENSPLEEFLKQKIHFQKIRLNLL